VGIPELNIRILELNIRILELSPKSSQRVSQSALLCSEIFFNFSPCIVH
jgi:hypothetical protein